MKKLDPGIREKLKLVAVDADADAIDMDRFPDFLIIGPQRTGTTWLHRNLVVHPQIFMPDDKEIYYFNTLRHPEYHPKDLPPVSAELSWYLRFFDETDATRAIRDPRCRELFDEPYEGSIIGEATASYAAGVDPQVLRDITLLNPEIKAILMIRHPIERAWSHAKKDLSRNIGKPLDEVTDDEFDEFFGRWYQVQCGHYTRLIDRWRTGLKPGHLMLGEYRHVKEDPAGLLTKVLDFIGARSDAKYVTDRSTQRFDTTERVPVPERFRERLAEVFREEIEALRTEHGLVFD